MLARVAETIYWMSRYIERVENIARLVLANGRSLLEMPSEFQSGWRPLVGITGADKVFDTSFEDASEQNVVRFLLWDEQQGALTSSLSLARASARTIREILPRDSWEALNGLHLEMQAGLKGRVSRTRRYVLLEDTIARCQRITGSLDGGLPRDYAWDFLSLGRHIERADMTSRILDLRFVGEWSGTAEMSEFYSQVQWTMILNALAAAQSFRQKVGAVIHRPSVINFLLLDSTFPRSVFFCLSEVENRLGALPFWRDPIRQIREMSLWLRKNHFGRYGDKRMHREVTRLQRALKALDEEIATTFFKFHP